MTIDDVERWTGLPVTDSQRLASAFLESKGLRMCCEYGINNCEQFAADIMAAEELGLKWRYVGGRAFPE